jgi:hypothetical protein
MEHGEQVAIQHHCRLLTPEIHPQMQKLSEIRGLLEKYPTFGRGKETGLPGALDT